MSELLAGKTAPAIGVNCNCFLHLNATDQPGGGPEKAPAREIKASPSRAVLIALLSMQWVTQPEVHSDNLNDKAT